MLRAGAVGVEQKLVVGDPDRHRDELLAWRQGMSGPALVTTLPGAAQGAAAASDAVLIPQ